MNQEHIEILEDLEKRKAIFTEVAQLVASLNKLSSSLEALVFSSGKSPVVEKAHELLDSLDENQLSLSIEKVELRLEHLDLRIRDDLSFFLELADTSNKPDLLSPQLNDELQDHSKLIKDKIEDFKRKVKLSFAYRVLLCEYGVTVEDIDLDVAPELITKALKQISRKEQYYQEDLVVKLKEFQKQTHKAITNEAIPESIREALMFAEHQLRENIQHLESGNSISSIPTSFETIDLNLSSSMNPNEDLNEQTKDKETSEDEASHSSKQKGLLSRAKAWLDSPIDVSWKDTK